MQRVLFCTSESYFDNIFAMTKPNTSLDIEEVFSARGLISKAFAQFEERPEQAQMAGAVHKTLLDGRHLVVEAGTGVGKSFAYLIPAIKLARQYARKVLISTFTITLQEQLINKDIPFLKNCIPGRFTPLENSQSPCNPQKRKSLTGFTAVLAKGRGNYLCKRRLEFTLRRQRLLFDKSASELTMINDWARRTDDGSLSDLSFVPKNHIWDSVKSEHGNCRGRKCAHFHTCFYWRARRRLKNADIIVANHALLFSDLVLKEQGASVLPDYHYVIIDEAHNIEHVAEEHFGIKISNHRIKFLLDGLYNPRTHRGLLAYVNAEKAIEIVSRINRDARIFFKQIRDWFEQTKDEAKGRCYKNFVDDRISGYLRDLRLELAKLTKQTEDADEKFEIMRFSDRCVSLTEDLECFLMQKKRDYVYWVELSGAKQGIFLRSAPIDVGPDVKKCLFDKFESVVMTSATLSTGSILDPRSSILDLDEHRVSSNKYRETGFDFFAGRIGLDDFDAVKLGSPFDYQKQVTIFIEKGLPDPNESAFIEAAAEVMKKYILKTKARAFVLFTSYKMLDGMAETLSDWLKENNIHLLQQGSGLDRTVLLKHFRDQNRLTAEKKNGHESRCTSGSAVLFGTDSFWQGVDVPGKALSNVIIVRLPFAVPEKPLIAGRLEQIKEQGGNPFYDYQLPLAIIKFKQGFGRLIRNKSDTGIVVILDSRIVNKSYGSRFLAAIPKCRIQIANGKSISDKQFATGDRR